MDEDHHPEVILRHMMMTLKLQSFGIHTLSTDDTTLAVADVKVDGVWYRLAVRYIEGQQDAAYEQLP